jgi:3-oxoacyl-[acyl-carrier-protein] synthase I
MRRVVVTGLGVVSSIGNNANEVLASLREAKSGVVAAPEYAELGFRCQVHAPPHIDWESMVDRRAARFLAQGTAYGHLAMEQAIADSGLEEAEVSHERTGLIVGSGGPSTRAIVEAAEITRTKGPKRVGPFAVPKAMSSGASAVLATWFKIKGLNFSISSACATSAHCIGVGYEQILMGKQDIVFAGGVEELDWTLSVMFDAMGAMSSNFNATPAVASRAYDKDRDGFVIAGGGGIVVLEEYEHAKARGAKIYAEVAGYGLSGDAYHITAPVEDGDGGFRAMKAALKDAGITPDQIDYINAHGTSTMADGIELGAVERLLGNAAGKTAMSSTKSMTGHLLGAAGAIESAFSILAIRDQIAPPTINLDNPDVETVLDLVPHKAKPMKIEIAMSNSFGFGGTNASVIFKQVS